MSDIQYLFDASGTWIAFRRGSYLFAPNGAWIGFFSPASQESFDIDGKYLGTQVGRDRLFYDMNPKSRFSDDHPGYPGREAEPDHPGYPGRAELPNNMEEVDLHLYA